MACGNVILEQDVEFFRCQTFRFRQTEVCPHETGQAEAAPDKATLAAKIPRRRVEYGRIELVGANTGDVVAIARDHDGLNSQARRRHFGDERVDGRANTDVVSEDIEAEQSRLCVTDRLIDLRNSQEADGDEDGEQRSQAADEERPPSDQRHDIPREDRPTKSNCVFANPKVKGLAIREPCLLKEVTDVSPKPDPARDLRHPDHARDFGTSGIGAFKAVPIRRPLADLALVLVGVYYHGDGVVDVEGGVAGGGQAEKGFAGIV